MVDTDEAARTAMTDQRRLKVLIKHVLNYGISLKPREILL